MDHCVGSYAENIAEGKSIILFIRQKDTPNIPYFTLQIDPKTFDVKQCRGFKNMGYDETIAEFLEKFKEHLKHKKSA